MDVLTVNELLNEFDRRYFETLETIAERDQQIAELKQAAQQKDRAILELQEQSKFTTSIQSQSQNDREELFYIIQDQAQQLEQFKLSKDEIHSQLTFYKEKVQESDRQLAIAQQTVAEYKKVLYSQAEQDELNSDFNQNLMNLVNK